MHIHNLTLKRYLCINLKYTSILQNKKNELIFKFILNFF